MLGWRPSPLDFGRCHATVAPRGADQNSAPSLSLLLLATHLFSPEVLTLFLHPYNLEVFLECISLRPLL